jgi:hypothetical protein
MCYKNPSRVVTPMATPHHEVPADDPGPGETGSDWLITRVLAATPILTGAALVRHDPSSHWRVGGASEATRRTRGAVGTAEFDRWSQRRSASA